MMMLPRALFLIEIMAWINNHNHGFLWDVITYPYLGHGWVILQFVLYREQSDGTWYRIYCMQYSNDNLRTYPAMNLNRHPIARLWGRAMGCLLKILWRTMTAVSGLCCMLCPWWLETAVTGPPLVYVQLCASSCRGFKLQLRTGLTMPTFPVLSNHHPPSSLWLKKNVIG